jgi:RNA polymerase sigma-70 factor (ECF subfamily)
MAFIEDPASPQSGQRGRRGLKAPDAAVPPPLVVASGESPAGKEATDDLLLARLSAGDQSALEVLLERYWEPIFRYAWRISGSRDTAADLAQSAFCRLWERRSSWKRSGSVRGLLFRIVRNDGVSRRRRRHARERAHQGFVELYVERDDRPSAAERAELRAALDDAVGRLPARRREVFLLRVVDGLSYAEIAEAMGIRKQTVANQLSRALGELRDRLGSLLDA